MARGSPSSCAHRAATGGRMSSVSSKEGTTSRARSANSRIAGLARMSSSRAPAPVWVSGTGSGPTGYSASPGTRSASRLVASTRSCRQEPSRAVSRSAHRSSTGSSRTPTAATTGYRMSDPGASGPRSTHHVRPRYVPRTRCANSSASRVLPTPAGPTSVTSRWRDSRGRRSASWTSRPTNASRPAAGNPTGAAGAGVPWAAAPPSTGGSAPPITTTPRPERNCPYSVVAAIRSSAARSRQDMPRSRASATACRSASALTRCSSARAAAARASSPPA